MYRYYTEQNFTNIANAIRQKQGSTAQFTPPEMGPAIRNLPVKGNYSGLKTVMYTGSSQASSIFLTESPRNYDMVSITLCNDTIEDSCDFYLICSTFNNSRDDIYFMINNSLSYDMYVGNNRVTISFENSDATQLSLTYSGSYYVKRIYGINYKPESTPITLKSLEPDTKILRDRSNMVSFDSPYSLWTNNKSDFIISFNIKEFEYLEDYSYENVQLLSQHGIDEDLACLSIKLENPYIADPNNGYFNLFCQFGGGTKWIYSTGADPDRRGSADSKAKFYIDETINVKYDKKERKMLVTIGEDDTIVAESDEIGTNMHYGDENLPHLDNVSGGFTGSVTYHILGTTWSKYYCYNITFNKYEIKII